MFIICTTRGLFSSVRNVEDFVLPLVSLLGCVPLLEVLFSLTMLFLSHKVQPLCTLVLLSDCKTSTPLGDREQQLFQYSLLQTDLQLCTLYVSLLIIFLPGSAKVLYDYLIIILQICSPKEKAVPCRLMILGIPNGYV